MNPLEQDILKAVEDELTRAREKFGAVFNSQHESYAIILEEFEEAQEESKVFQSCLEGFWACVKNNDTAGMKSCVRQMEERAIRAAAEFVQVAAMCRKVNLTAIANSKSGGD